MNRQSIYQQKCAKNCISSIYQICCQTDNCNEVKVKPKVMSCYNSVYVIQNEKEIYHIPVAKVKCVSPENQYCQVK